jgi:Sigma-70 region 2
METPLRSVPEPVDGQLDSLDESRSFERFFDAERTRLFGALAVMSGNRAEAEEVMQDAFLKVWERWDRVSAMESPEGFLYRTALNVYRKSLRRAATAVRRADDLPTGGRCARQSRDTRRGRSPEPNQRSAPRGTTRWYLPQPSRGNYSHRPQSLAGGRCSAIRPRHIDGANAPGSHPDCQMWTVTLVG